MTAKKQFEEVEEVEAAAPEGPAVQVYPKMLYKDGKAPASGTEVAEGESVVVASPAEEAEANEDGFKTAGSKPTSVKKS